MRKEKKQVKAATAETEKMGKGSEQAALNERIMSGRVEVERKSSSSYFLQLRSARRKRFLKKERNNKRRSFRRLTEMKTPISQEDISSGGKRRKCESAAVLDAHDSSTKDAGEAYIALVQQGILNVLHICIPTSGSNSNQAFSLPPPSPPLFRPHAQ